MGRRLGAARAGGRLLVTAGTGLTLWNPATGERLGGVHARSAPIPGEPMKMTARYVLGAGFAADGAEVVLVTPAGGCRWAADDRQLLGVLLAEVGGVGCGDREQLGDDRRHAVEVAAAAVLGRSVDPRLLAAATGREPGETEAALLAAVGLHLLRLDPDGGFVFSHDTVRD